MTMQYSASALDHETVIYRLDDHDTRESLMKT
jgi:hypothetical protein